jgi:hypothetical protein
MRVTANATRAGNWWAVDVPEVEGLFTQAKRLDLIPAMVVDAAGLLGADVTESEVDVHPQIDPAIIGGLIDARELRELATLASRYAAFYRFVTSVSRWVCRTSGRINLSLNRSNERRSLWPRSPRIWRRSGIGLNCSSR